MSVTSNHFGIPSIQAEDGSMVSIKLHLTPVDWREGVMSWILGPAQVHGLESKPCRIMNTRIAHAGNHTQAGARGQAINHASKKAAGATSREQK